MKPLFLLLATAILLCGQARELTLDEAIALATQRSPSIQIASLRILESRGIFGQVSSGYKPQLNMQVSLSRRTNNLGSAGLSFPGIPRRVGPFSAHDARPVLEQTIFDLSLIRDMQAARLRIRQAKWDAESLREATLLSVIQLYLQTLEAQSRMAAASARLETARTLLDQSQDFLDVGTANRLDYTRAEVQFQRETAELIDAKQVLQTSQFLLLETVGLPATEEVQLTEAFRLERRPAPSLEDALGQALERRPEILALEAKLGAAGRDVDSAKSRRAPTLGFRGDYGISANTIDTGVSTYSYGVSVKLPVFQGGRIKAETAAARARRRQVAQELEEVRLRVTAEVRTALVQIEAARESAQAAVKGARAATEALELAQARFGAGISNNLDVVQAQETLAGAENFESETLFRYHLAKANLARTLGDVASFR